MNRRALWFPALIALAACQGSETTQPSSLFPTSPAFAVEDGANGGNEDFWFLSPLVPNPSGNPTYLDNGFNPTLVPTVEINDISVSVPGSVVLAPANASLNGSHYQLVWKIPDGANKTYRITVKVGSEVMGFADVKTAANASQLKNTTTNETVAVPDGRNLPIRFVIEQNALCLLPGAGSCSSEIVDLNTGGDVRIQGPTGELGVIIPPQGNGGSTTVTVKLCDVNDPGFTDMNPAVTDLPTYGPCVTVNTDPPLQVDLQNAATVFICDITPSLPEGMAHDQQKRITMHRYDPGSLVALPHAPFACGQVASAGSVKGMMANLLKGSFRSAGRQFVSMLTPRPLHAAMMLDVGAGGFTFSFSAFEFVLPAKMDKCSPWLAGQVANVGQTLSQDPTVCVTDVAGLPVEGATVHFTTADGSVSAPSFTTGSNGIASVSWTLGSLGLNSLTASGRGIGGSDNNGPRPGVDPFQPLSDAAAIGDASDGPAVPVLTGSEIFTADANVIPYGSGGYTYLLNVAGDGHTTWFGTPRPPVTGGVAVPALWYSPSFTPAGWVTNGVAAFGTTGTCSINSNVKTTWPIDTDILVRKTFVTSGAGTLTIEVPIDNDVQVWLGGVNITSSAGDYSTTPETNRVVDGASGTADDWFVHGFCADNASPTFTASVGAGSHVLAIRGADYGSVAFLDVKITFVPSPSIN